MKKKSLYKKSLLIFTILLSILGIIFLGYVYNSMVLYERNLVDNYIYYLAESGKLTEDIDENLFTKSKYEKNNANILDGVAKLLKSDELKIDKNSKLSSDKLFAYDLKIGDKLISTVTLKSKKTYKKMAILTINEWEVDDIVSYFDEGIYAYEIKIPSNYKVSINGVALEDADILKESDVEGLDRVTSYIEIEKSKEYKITNLVYEPEIKITDEAGKDVKYNIADNKIVISKEFKKIEKFDDAKEYIKDNFDVIALAKNWSLFLTDDLYGSYHGFNVLTPYLIKDSYMYGMAYNWSHGEDILFVSSHRLKNPVFTNESIKNFTIYNENAFSCEVYLEKNMVVSGKDKVDKMHDRLYFVYYEGGYKLVDMQSIKD